MDERKTNLTGKDAFVKKVMLDFKNKVDHNKTTLERLGMSLGIKSQNEVKEYTELAIVLLARAIAHSKGTTKEKYDRIVLLYEGQVNLSHRTSESVLLQQYSTPAPIGYLAGLYTEPDAQKLFFEPSAGNGLLTIAANPKTVLVNEIDPIRNSNLQGQGFRAIFEVDGSKKFTEFDKHFDCVVTNPPFGVLDKEVQFDGFSIKSLDQLMALRALETMKDEGKGAFIIGGHTNWDSKGRIQAGRNRIFFNYLYRHYHVDDVVLISGKHLYSRQGTSFNTRLVLVNGRKKMPNGVAPLRDKISAEIVTDFGRLFTRITSHFSGRNETPIMRSTSLQSIETRIFKLALENNLALNKEAQRAAMDLIRSHVVGGASIVELKKSYLGAANSDYYASIGGYVQGKKISNDKILVSRVNGKEVNQVFSLDQIYHQILQQHNKLKALDGPYYPASEACTILDTYVPDGMDFETHEAIFSISKEVGGDLNRFVMQRLGYKSESELCKVLAAEQIDAVAMAIYNIEFKNEGMVVGDQTGIGKGRVAAAMIRYACHASYRPIFITEKANLFSDIYRDLSAIGSADLVPFIVNGRESKTDVKDENGQVVYQALDTATQNRVFAADRLAYSFDYVLATYSQFNSPDKKPLKPAFLSMMAKNNIVIMDESHNASGSSNTGVFLQEVLKSSKGVTFLSATFAKRPDNMPVYAMKTSISEANLSSDELITAISNGGVALQEVLASQLVKEGQMIRRERSYEGIEVNYISLEGKEAEHVKIADRITEIIRDIIAFQRNYITPMVSEIDDILKEEGEESMLRSGTEDAGIANTPYFSKVFNIINQMLFSIKAEEVAAQAIKRLEEGKKPVIAFSSTMGSFLDDMTCEDGELIQPGDTINADFTEVLKKGLSGVMKYTVRKYNGKSEQKIFTFSDLSPSGRKEYERIYEELQTVSSGISISPIDIIIQLIEEKGYSVAEVTGRKSQLQINRKNNKAVLKNRKKLNTNDAFREFNNNEVDVLLINQSGSTGASAHAIVTDKVPFDKVKQRVMIVLQAELNINTEVQKRGRINRTGQIYKPIYDYVNSAIPAEKRLMMMLQKKLKSLDANTASNQKQSKGILNVEDFLNKYGDSVVAEFLKEHPEINILLGDPLKFNSDQEDETVERSKLVDAAHKVSGRVAVLSVQMQQYFYEEISERYSKYIEYLKQSGDYDLEIEVLDLQAKTLSKEVIKVGKGGKSQFGSDTYLESVVANVLRKPFTKEELVEMIGEELKGQDPSELTKNLVEDFQAFSSTKREEDARHSNAHYAELIAEVSNEKKIKKLKESERHEAIEKRREELEEAHRKANEAINRASINKENLLMPIFRFFEIGKGIIYPKSHYEKDFVFIKGIFLGFVIDRKKKNPYVPSSIRLRFALTDSTRYLEIPASMNDQIKLIMQNTRGLTTWQSEEIRADWTRFTTESSLSRTRRYIITGNLLQAYADFRGKLVNYTLEGGGEKKGILLPQHWEKEKSIKGKVIVPIYRALIVIQGLSIGTMVSTSNSMGFISTYNGFKFIVPGSKIKGGHIYLNPEIRELIETGNFNKVSGKMIGEVKNENLPALCELLQENFSVSVELSAEQFSRIKEEVSEEVKVEENIMPALLSLEARHFSNSKTEGTLLGVVTLQTEGHPLIRTISIE